MLILHSFNEIARQFLAKSCKIRNPGATEKRNDETHRDCQAGEEILGWRAADPVPPAHDEPER